jgi:hypothetical protein
MKHIIVCITPQKQDKEEISMKEFYVAILVSCGTLFISAGANATGLPRSFVTPVLTDIPDTCLDGSCMSSEEFPKEIFLAKKQGREKYNCMELCAKVQYQCETTNKKANKIGTKKNWDGSRDCVNKYRKCLDKCEE